MSIDDASELGRRQAGGTGIAIPADGLALIPPSLERLPRYAAALATGWSPSTTENVSARQLAALNQDATAFLRELTRRDGTAKLADGRVVPRLPGPVFWIWDGDFCGSINLRYAPGTDELPDHVSGHIGYSVVPWRRRLGYASRALALLLPHARAAGLARVLLTCDFDNVGSQKVILGNGGMFAGTRPPEPPSTKEKLQFWVPTRASAEPRGGRVAGDELALRPAQPSDLELARTIYFETMRGVIEHLFGWDETRASANFVQTFKAEEASVITLDGGDVGWLQVQEQPASITLGQLYVRGPYQRRGIGSWVMRHLLEDADRRSKPVHLSVVRYNPAVRLYERCGFVATHEDSRKVHMRRPAAKA